MALLDMQGMDTPGGGGGGEANSTLSLLCHSSNSIVLCL
ncbi:SapB/AmfS family lanthipeptide [Actinoallomurus sp. NBC_01490]|jgi:hypothetical protein|nr:SapB/AmfS family lanthipeptide [Actinoallomurus sp. NBC_01490]